jgi:hypothetical protein
MPEDLCQTCRKSPATMGGHWVHGGKVYSEYLCTKCYGGQRGMSEKEQERLEETVEIAPPPRALPEVKIALWQPSFPVRN